MKFVGDIDIRLTYTMTDVVVEAADEDDAERQMKQIAEDNMDVVDLAD